MHSHTNPVSGGIEIPPTMYSAISKQVDVYAATRPWHDTFQLNLRFKNQFCYLDASEKNDDIFPVGRLRYFGSDKWSLAFYAYSHERYEPCVFLHGEWFGTLEQAISVCEIYLV